MMPFNRIFARECRQRGAALVEFTLVVPLLLMILFGIIEFSVLLYDKAVVTNASLASPMSSPSGPMPLNLRKWQRPE